MVAVSEVYQEARGLKDLTPGNMIREMLTASPSIRVAGQVNFPRETLFLTSPIRATSDLRVLNEGLNSMAGEMPPFSKITPAEEAEGKPKITPYTSLSFFLKDNDPQRVLRLGKIETTVQPTDTPHQIEVVHYPHPWLADAMLVFQRLAQADSNIRLHRNYKYFLPLMDKVRNIDFDEEHLVRFRRMLYEMKLGEEPRSAWRTPNAGQS